MKRKVLKCGAPRGGLWLSLLAALLLASCQQSKPVRYTARPITVAPQPAPDTSYIDRQRMLADLLYAAKVAYNDNRLMTPAGNNAYDRYREVLAMEPNNQVALQGLNEIVARYVLLADEARNKGQYDQAQTLLDRAALVDGRTGELNAAYERLAQSRTNRVDLLVLDPEQLSLQSPQVTQQLGAIAQDILRRDLTFLINARNDE
ncbi:MAG: hypothetical protein LBE21_01145, partial [Pseudomonadales bacterium]|nr:hypothetical protein [Pseudomonadales bacterium]